MLSVAWYLKALRCHLFEQLSNRQLHTDDIQKHITDQSVTRKHMNFDGTTYSYLPHLCCRTPQLGMSCHTESWWSENKWQFHKTDTWPRLLTATYTWSESLVNGNSHNLKVCSALGLCPKSTIHTQLANLLVILVVSILCPFRNVYHFMCQCKDNVYAQKWTYLWIQWGLETTGNSGVSVCGGSTE